ncbi:MAG: ABC transporter transmembrane domain-containing protein [Xenococcaceae cyanobacterium MO_188.B32]|nr:ABC transporter transmembrane domain-containing protein [Xenococcaceae cyanobacterium MO_188.B32]
MNLIYLDHLVWNFIVLILLAFSTGLLAEYLLISLSQSAVHKLRLRLSRWILSCPLRQLEELGSNRLLAVLTDDVEAISITVSNIPFLFADIAMILGCFIYLGWLSGLVFIGTVGCLGLAIAFVYLLQSKAHRLLKLAREEKDILFKHFRTIIEGIKELKLHTCRREAFIAEELQVTTIRNKLRYRT